MGITSKLSSALYAIRSSKNFLNEKARLSLYYSLFHSHIIYANQIWSCTSDSQLKNITKLQKTAIRLVCNKPNYAHTQPLFFKLEVMPINDLSFYFKSQFMYFYTRNMTPSAFRNTWVNRHRDIRLRRNQDEDENLTPFCRLACVERMPWAALPNAWRNTPLAIREATSVAQFNQQLKSYLLEKLNRTLVCNRVLCPECTANI
jgi:hypothetical protein